MLLFVSTFKCHLLLSGGYYIVWEPIVQGYFILGYCPDPVGPRQSSSQKQKDQDNWQSTSNEMRKTNRKPMSTKILTG